MHQLHPSAGNSQRPGQVESGKERAETARQVACTQAVQLGGIVALDRQRRQLPPVVGADAAGRAQVDGRPHDPTVGLQGLAGEESGAAVAHGQQRPAIDRGIEAEAEQVGVTLAEKAFDADIVMDCLARARQSAVKGDHSIQQAVDRQAAGDEVNPHVAGQEQICLPCLDRDAGRNPSAVQVPGVGMDVMFGHDPAAGHGAGLPLQRHDPVHQHQRCVRQSHPGRETVRLGKFGAEHAGDAADREFHAHLAVEDAGLVIPPPLTGGNCLRGILWNCVIPQRLTQ